ncbi:Transmembrane epididymal protein 1A [Camelus dromedarius]|uniref:Transmembrane Epididymal protein 1A n=3 Tax=Camelus TaxID=9836 RepID=S9WVF1_CAMFR|nr:transmembrane epididymal protein 1A [Camelus ferus]XP_010957474.1 transmembrane epididymal protein 1A-like [Camelus bactrianus]XP_010974486.1 transmembrane epididymal protein 1A-like [Camelus dromedarius]EPY82382.1 putative membrane protein Re9-like protein [Camelus ferus]KAB1284091.1 Transmembrane epididymal protein 1A [Camelus dromedarius]
MGTLEGHLLPGSFFLFYSLYYSVLTSLALLRGQRFLRPPLPPREKRGHRWWQLFPVEGVVKIVISLIGIFPEFFYPLGVSRLRMVDWEDPRRPFMFKDNWQHVTMYGFFLLSGVVDIVSQACQARQNMKLERAAEALAFFVLVLMMGSHIENKGTLEIRVHVLFMVPTFLVSLVLTIEVWVPDQPQLWVLKTWMGLVLSNWMLHFSVLLYVPPSGQPWRAENPVDLAFLTIFFCWHLGLAAAMLAAVYGLCSLWHHRFSSWREASGNKYELCPTGEGSPELERLTAGGPLQDRGI